MIREESKQEMGTFYSNRGKRILDFLGALIGILLLSPLFALIMLVVRSALGRPIFFKQNRPGLHGRPFVCIKFRTMLQAVDPEGKPIPDARTAGGFQVPDSGRVPSVGRFLRATSLDEIPELVNVLRGDMSLVGPRPLLMQYLSRYSHGQMRRHEVRPGITGWAQVNGRNAISWDDRLALDVWYVDNLALWLDLKILMRTIWKTIVREGINQSEQSTMEEFTGTIKAKSEMGTTGSIEPMSNEPGEIVDADI